MVIVQKADVAACVSVFVCPSARVVTYCARVCDSASLCVCVCVCPRAYVTVACVGGGAEAGVKSMPVRRWSGDRGLTTSQEQRW